MKSIDRYLNSITMYRLILNFLKILSGVAFVMAAFHLLPFSLLHLFYSFMIVNVVAYSVNALYAKLFRIQQNLESSSITSFILFLVLAPPTTLAGAGIIALTAFAAIASKFIFNIRGRHIFNPVAIALVAIGLAGFGQATWWIGSAVLLPFTLVGGLLVVRKIGRFPMVLSFAAVALIEITALGMWHGSAFLPSVAQAFTSWPLVFFGTIMLTEPATMPSSRNMRIVYGVLVGLLFGSQWNIGPLYSTPEVALSIGNLFAFFGSYRPKLRLYLKEKRDIALNVKEFVFSPVSVGGKPFAFKPGQYMEWTYVHEKTDTRGFRRYFTIASSPTEDEVKIGIRMQREKGSTFKSSLADMKIGDEVMAGSLAGDFVLPKDKEQKLAFIAGGIGITPFRSMVKYLIDKKERRDIIVYYLANTESDFAYKDIFKEGEAVGVKTIYSTSRLENELKDVPHVKERHWYLSGPNAMVEIYAKTLTELGVPSRSIKKDYFPGF